MTNLFYSENEEILFWIAGYTADNNSSLVINKINSLKENALLFAKASGCKLGTIRTIYVRDRSKYKFNRVFYCESPKNIPEGTFHIGKDWTIWKWLEY